MGPETFQAGLELYEVAGPAGLYLLKLKVGHWGHLIFSVTAVCRIKGQKPFLISVLCRFLSLVVEKSFSIVFIVITALITDYLSLLVWWQATEWPLLACFNYSPWNIKGVTEENLKCKTLPTPLIFVSHDQMQVETDRHMRCLCIGGWFSDSFNCSLGFGGNRLMWRDRKRNTRRPWYL